jgi:hypothetical protein
VTDPLVLRVVARYKAAGTDYDIALWDNAVKDLKKLNTLYTKAKKSQAEGLLAIYAAVGKLKGLTKWVITCFEDPTADRVWDSWERVGSEKTLGSLTTFIEDIQGLMSEIAPAHFEYSGFKIINDQRISDAKCRSLLECVDFLLATFKKSDITDLLLEGINTIILIPTNPIESGFGGLYNPETRELSLTTIKGNPKRVFLDWFNHIFLHEFGHYVHIYYLSKEAKADWDSPWDEGENPGSVSPYGGKNKHEDFAETFVAFVAAPEKLTPTAKFRMQRALSLSGLYGKPVMRLATNDSIVSRVVYRYLNSSSEYTVKRLGPETVIHQAELAGGRTVGFKSPNRITYAVVDRNGNVLKSKDSTGKEVYEIWPNKRTAEGQAYYWNNKT